jgi:PPOX class probable F420-dependent enzyme
MADVASDQLWQMIAGTREGILATIGKTGAPQLSNVYFVSDPPSRTIWLSTTTVRTKGRNLLRDPRATLHVSGKDFLNFAVADGEVTLSIPTHPDDASVDELFEIHSALGAAPERGGFGEQMIADHRLVVRLAVTRVYGQVVNR